MTENVTQHITLIQRLDWRSSFFSVQMSCCTVIMHSSVTGGTTQWRTKNGLESLQIRPVVRTRSNRLSCPKGACPLNPQKGFQIWKEDHHLFSSNMQNNNFSKYTRLTKKVTPWFSSSCLCKKNIKQMRLTRIVKELNLVIGIQIWTNPYALNHRSELYIGKRS